MQECAGERIKYKLGIYMEVIALKTWRWLPRILTIIYILFISLFALDAFGGDESILLQIGGFLIHLLPSFLLVGALMWAWRKPLVGAILFSALGVMSIFAWDTYQHLLNFAVLSLPLLITGVLYYVSHSRRA